MKCHIILSFFLAIQCNGCSRKYLVSSRIYYELAQPQKKDSRKDKDVEEICFPQVGCFGMNRPWKSLLRPIPLPYSPERMDTTIWFYNRENSEKEKLITLYPQINMNEANFDANMTSVVIVHGYRTTGNSNWMREMKNAYLKNVDANIMLVDWGAGALTASFFQVTSNTRVVGRQLALFIKYLMQNYNADPKRFHLIGHSFGAHIVSYAAKEVPDIGRVTGLDPVQYGFEEFGKKVRIDKTDAAFVDIVHTDSLPTIPSLGAGMIRPVGHVDFYMNGGFDQPGCLTPPKDKLPKLRNIMDFLKIPTTLIMEAGQCPHSRAHQYLVEAFDEPEKCIFWGHKATVTNVFKSATNTLSQGWLKKYVAFSSNCTKDNCVPFGFDTHKTTLRGSFVVMTAERKPYCIPEQEIKGKQTKGYH